MTPIAIDPERAAEKLRAIERFLGDLELYRGATAEQMAVDRVARNVVERVMIGLVDLAASTNVHLVVGLGDDSPREYRQSFRAARDLGIISDATLASVAGSPGLRNALVHMYVDMDLVLLAAAIPLALEGYRAYVREVSRWLLDHT